MEEIIPSDEEIENELIKKDLESYVKPFKLGWIEGFNMGTKWLKQQLK